MASTSWQPRAPRSFVYAKTIAASTGSDFSGNPAYAQCACGAIEMKAPGTLVYVNRFGDTVSESLDAGFRMLEAYSISASTTVPVVCYW